MSSARLFYLQVFLLITLSLSAVKSEFPEDYLDDKGCYKRHNQVICLKPGKFYPRGIQEFTTDHLATTRRMHVGVNILALDEALLTTDPEEAMPVTPGTIPDFLQPNDQGDLDRGASTSLPQHLDPKRPLGGRPLYGYLPPPVRHEKRKPAMKDDSGPKLYGYLPPPTKKPSKPKQVRRQGDDDTRFLLSGYLPPEYTAAGYNQVSRYKNLTQSALEKHSTRPSPPIQETDTSSHEIVESQDSTVKLFGYLPPPGQTRHFESKHGDVGDFDDPHVHVRTKRDLASQLPLSSSRTQTFDDEDLEDSCESTSLVETPLWMTNADGKWRAIVNTERFPQSVRMSYCSNSTRSHCGDNCACKQRRTYRQLLSYDPEGECRGIFMDWFIFASGCVCRCRPT